MARYLRETVADDWRIDCEGTVDFNGTNDVPTKPQMHTRRKLLVAGGMQARRGEVSDAALEIVNAFYTDDRQSAPEKDRSDVFGDY